MAIIENVKGIADIIKQLGDNELYRKIVEVEAEIIELTQTAREQGAEIRRLRQRGAIIANLRYNSPFYANEDGSHFYCARCIESDGATIHVVQTPEVRMGCQVWSCPHCKADYFDMQEVGRSLTSASR